MTSVRVWWCRTSAVEVWREQAVAWLQPAESKRYAAFVFRGDALRFLTGTVLLKAVIAEMSGAAPSRTSLTRRCACGREHGRPRDVAGDLALSLAHCQDLVVVAGARGGGVGVDVERVPEQLPVDLVSRVVAPGEEVPASPADFARLWCRKEAWLKATGEGLRFPMERLAIGAGGWGHEDGGVRSVGEGSLVDLAVPLPGFRAALAATSGAPRPSTADGEMLLDGLRVAGA